MVDYNKSDKTDLYNELYKSHNEALQEITNKHGRITIHFDQIKVSKDAIFITGTDNGEFDKIRQEFMSSVERPEQSKQPPQIIHSTLARFTLPIGVGPISDFINQLDLTFVQTVEEFELTHVTREPMLDYAVIKRYPLV